MAFNILLTLHGRWIAEISSLKSRKSLLKTSQLTMRLKRKTHLTNQCTCLEEIVAIGQGFVVMVART